MPFVRSASPTPRDETVPPGASAAAREAERAARHLALAGALGLVLFVAVAGYLAWQLRSVMLAGLVARDADALAAVVEVNLAPAEADLLLEADLPREDLLLEHLLEIASLRGVLGMRLHGPDGELTQAVPVSFVGTPGGHAAPPTRPSDGPRTEYLPAAEADAWFAGLPAAPPAPLLRIQIPLTLPVSRELLGSVEFLLDGSSLAAQRRALDRRLLLQIGLVAGLALALGAAVHRWAWLRLRRQAAALAAQQTRLLRANADLALAVKSSAIGEITAHLLHDLKNPLAGLESFVQLGVEGESAPASDDWQSAASAAARLRSLVAEIADLLGDLESGGGIDLSTGEVLAALRTRHEPFARERGVRLVTAASASAGGSDTEDDAGQHSPLLVLVLSNLLRNALEAAPAGSAVTLAADAPDPSTSRTTWRVDDAGPGLPEAIRARLFQPCRSSKPSGSGIGLAISAQIARRIGADLALEHSSPAGTRFVLKSLPNDSVAPRLADNLQSAPS